MTFLWLVHTWTHIIKNLKHRLTENYTFSCLILFKCKVTSRNIIEEYNVLADLNHLKFSGLKVYKFIYDLQQGKEYRKLYHNYAT